MFMYYKVEGNDFFGFPFVLYLRTKKPIRNAHALAVRLYCERTGNSIASVHAPRASYALAYAWHTSRGRHTTPESWSADVISTITI